MANIVYRKGSIPTVNPTIAYKGSPLTNDELDGNFRGIQDELDTKAPINNATFTGTTTIPAADINGGAIDGTPIGATAPSSGAFTSLSTTGSATIGNDSSDVLYIQYGAVASPGLSFSGDVDTGLWRPFADTIAISAGGSEKIRATTTLVTLTGNTSVTGTLAVGSDVSINTNKFTIAATSGNTAIAGTLGVTGATTLSSTLGVTGATTLSSTLGVTGDVSVNTNKFNITAASGNTSIAGTLGVTGDVSVNTNKFNITAASGNTSIAGTLGVTEATTLSSTLGVTGATTLSSTLGVTSLATFSGGVTLSGNTTAATEYFRITDGAGTPVTKFLVDSANGNTTVEGTLGVTGATTLSSTLGVTGNVSVNTNKFNIIASSGNTAIAGTLGVTGATTLSSTLGVTGATTLSSTLDVTGATTLSSTLGVTGNVSVNTNKFTITAASGNTNIAGTLDVTGATTLSSTLGVTGNVSVNTNKFNIIASSGNTAIAGTLGVTDATTLSSTLGVTGNVTVNTNKFIITAASGNTSIAGTLGVTDATTLSSTLGVTGATTLSSTLGVTGNVTVNTNKFIITAASGNTSIAGTLDVTGATTLSSTLGVASLATFSGGVTLSGNETAANEYFRITNGAGTPATKFLVDSANGNTTISGTLEVTGATAINGGLTMDTDKFIVADGTGVVTAGASITLQHSGNAIAIVGNSGSTTANVFNTISTTLNFGGAGTSISIGSSSGTTNVKHNLDVDLDLNVDGGDITTSATSFNLINGTATTVNFAGAGTSISIGSSSGTTNVKHNLDVDLDLNVDGGDITTSATSFNLLNATATTINFGGAADVLIGGAAKTITSNGNFAIATDKTFSQSGTGTFSTGSGAVSLNGNTSVTGSKTFTVGNGATSLGGTLSVTSTTTLSDNVTVGNNKSVTLQSDYTANSTTYDGDTVLKSYNATLGAGLSINGVSVIANATKVSTTTLDGTIVGPSFDISQFRTVEFTVQIKRGAIYQSSKILAIHDGTNVEWNEYSIVRIGGDWPTNPTNETPILTPTISTIGTNKVLNIVAQSGSTTSTEYTVTAIATAI
jgi:collagen type VII alpha